VQVSDFDFDLPPDQIAQEPPAERGTSRLLILDRASGTVTHAAIPDLPHLLDRADLLVVNDTRVFPARLLGHRVPSGGAVECLLLARFEAEDASKWDALMHPGQKLRVGERVLFERNGVRIHGEILGRHFYGRRTIRLWTDGEPLDAAIEAVGHVPLPPYIKRVDRPDDRDRYQTVYASRTGSVAAPTAGLHFTDGLLAALDARGLERTAITLHVGYGTFKPVRADAVEDHAVDAELYEIGPDAAARIEAARRAGRRIVAVGTTTVRALESAGLMTGRDAGPTRADVPMIRPGRAQADLFIYPGHSFAVVGGLLTNFHLPRSSLLMLVCALAGRERVLDAYREAVARGYRFYSYGDAMLIR
jgi:S-adenosylmethionine:tRNA ribosyltransferase-isomerase